MRKTALLTGVAGLFLMTAPAFAQDSTAPQTPPPAEQPAAAQPQSLTLNPGQTVRGSDGSELGKLVGARTTETGQELTVRGTDGQIRGVPTAGITQQGADVAVGWTTAEFQAAPPIADDAAVPAAEPAAPAAPADPSMTSPDPVEPAAPVAEPMTSPSASPAPAEQPTPVDEPEA